MLAILNKSVAQCPEGLCSPNPESGSYALKDGILAQHFSSLNPNAFTINVPQASFFAYSSHNPNPLLPRLFTVVDDIFCLFQGRIENFAALKQQYALSKTGNEVSMVIEAYRSLRDRGPYPIDHVVRDLQGKFAFILYDAASQNSLVATDPDGSVPFFWGADLEGHLVISDDVETVKKGCGKSFAPFPKGCFFTSSGGLRSYEHPCNEVKPVPRVDSSGDVCGANFQVDSEAKKESLGISRVGSAADWSSNY